MSSRVRLLLQDRQNKKVHVGSKVWKQLEQSYAYWYRHQGTEARADATKALTKLKGKPLWQKALQIMEMMQPFYGDQLSLTVSRDLRRTPWRHSLGNPYVTGCWAFNLKKLKKKKQPNPYLRQPQTAGGFRLDTPRRPASPQKADVRVGIWSP